MKDLKDTEADNMQTPNLDDSDLLRATDGDVYLIAYPKAGVTWTTEVLTAIYSQYATENPSQAKEFEGAVRAHGFCTSCPLSRRHSTKPGMAAAGYDLNGNVLSNEEAEDQDNRRRLISFHFTAKRMQKLCPDAFTNENVKIIYVMRHPKDIAVSYYHFHKMNETLPTPESWDDFLQDFMDGVVRHGSWFEHVRGWWQKYEELQEMKSNKILLLTFASLKMNPSVEIERICDHIGIKLSQEGVKEVAHRCTFASMKRDPRRNHSQNDIFKGDFLRKGAVGDWNNQFTTAQSQHFDKMMHIKLKEESAPIMNALAI